MRKTLVCALFLACMSVSGAASANVGAAIDAYTGKIQYVMGNASRTALVKAALKKCEKLAQEKDACEPVKNTIGVCEHPEQTGYRFGAFAGSRTEDGWVGFLSCARSTEEAREWANSSCGSCAIGQTFYDVTEEQ